jgi:cbb3-type cytochrome oxidase subunit 3
MEWNEVLKFMETYWLQQVCVLMVAVITWIYRRQLKKIQRNIQEQQAMRSAMMAL